MGQSKAFEIPAAEWLAAAQVRRSCRRLDGRPVEADKLANLADVCERFRPWSGARVVLVEKPGTEVFRGFIGSYGKITGASSVLLFVADRSSAEALVAIGYASEAVLLEATRSGLATCWVGGGFRPGAASSFVDLDPAERVVGVSPLGCALRRPVAGGGARPAIPRKRKQLSVIAAGWEAWPDWARAGVACARIAPSAMNRQPWRFSWDAKDGLTVAMDADRLHAGISKRIDVGIAMLNFEIAATVAGAPGTWSLAAGRQVARYDLNAAPLDGDAGTAADAS